MDDLEEINKIKTDIKRIRFRLDALNFRLKDIWSYLTDEEKASDDGVDLSSMITVLDIVDLILKDGVFKVRGQD